MDLSLEQLMDIKVDTVFGASKFEQRTSQAPALISVVTADEIKKQGHRTLAEVLRSLSGIYVNYDRNYSNLGIRGFGRPGDFNTRVLLVVDGHRMNDNLYGSALIGREAMIDVDLIDRVEVIRGPSSSIYGNSAFFGVVNVITRKAEDFHGVEASAAAGGWGGYQGRVSYGKKFDTGLEVLLSGTAYGSEGKDRLFFQEFDSPRTNHGIAEDADGEYARSAYARVRYEEFTLSAGYALREKQVPTASFGTVFNNGHEETADEQYFADLRYDHSFSDHLQLSARAYYDYYNYRADYPYNYAAPDAHPFLVLSHDDNYGDGAGTEVQLTWKFRKRDTLIVGAEYRRLLNLRQSNFTDHPTTYNFDIRHDDSWSSVFAQSDIALTDRLTLNAGLRYDYYTNFGGTANPRLALIFQADPKTTLKLLYGQAYRAPNAYELYLDSPGYLKSNPDLQPETIRTYEAVLERVLRPNLRLSLSGYYYDTKDLISQTADPASGLLMFNNVSEATAHGLELSLFGDVGHGATVRASYAVQYAQDEETHMELTNSPRQMAKLGVIAPLYRDLLHAGLDLQYYGGTKTIRGARNPGFLLANATLFSHEIARGLELSASVYNLFDKKYRQPGSTGNVEDTIPQDGRSFWLKLTYQF